RDAAEHDGIDPTTTQLVVEIRAVERAPLMLRDENVGRTREAVDEIRPSGGQRRQRSRLVDRLPQGIAKVGGVGDVDQNDGRPGGAEPRREIRRGLNDLGRGPRCGRHAHDALLQIDEHEGGRARVEWIHSSVYAFPADIAGFAALHEADDASARIAPRAPATTSSALDAFLLQESHELLWLLE